MRIRLLAAVAVPAAAFAAAPVLAAAGRGEKRPAPQFFEAEGLLPALEASTTPDDEYTPGQPVARRAVLDPAASGNAYVRFENVTRGSRFTLRFRVRASSTYTLVVRPIRGPGHGVVRLAVDGRRLGPGVDLGAGRVRRGRVLRFADLALAGGDHTLTVTVVRRSRGLGAGLDYFELRR